MSEVKAGDTVRCIDATSRPDWAAWYMDNGYADDMLVRGKSYPVHAVAERDGKTGYDIGVPTPWGDPFWNADRFERALLRLPVEAFATSRSQHEGAGR